MKRLVAALLSIGVGIGLLVAGPQGAQAARAAARTTGATGASGIGDSYFPADGNGGYDVDHGTTVFAFSPNSARHPTSVVLTDISLFSLLRRH